MSFFSPAHFIFKTDYWLTELFPFFQMYPIVLVPHYTLFRPYNARLTREAVAPIQPAWKGRMNGGPGATFAERPPVLTHPSKGRVGHAESG
jgi:hypothetical protein